MWVIELATNTPIAAAMMGSQREIINRYLLEHHADSCGKPEVVAEERLLRGAAVAERGSGIFQQAVAGVDANDRSSRREDLDTAAGVEREHRASGRKLARQRRRKNQDAGDRLAAGRQAGRPQHCEGTHAGEPRASGNAEESFDATAAERDAAGGRERTWIDVHLRFDPNQIDRMPRESPAETDVSRIDLARVRRGALRAGVKALLRIRARARGHEEEENHEGREEREVQGTKIHFFLYAFVVFASGSAPSCCISPSMSASRQCSATLPSRMWKMCVSEIVYSRPEAGIPMKSPCCFACAVTRTATLSSSASMSSILNLTSESPACTRRMACLSGSTPDGIFPQLCGVKSGVTSFSAPSALPLTKTSSMNRRTATLFCSVLMP